VDAGILGRAEGWQAWNEASLSTRVDAVIAHEWTEFGVPQLGDGAHSYALANTPSTTLNISPRARALLVDQGKRARL